MPEDDAKEHAKPIKLQLKDYVALTIAALETFLLPLVVIIAILAVLEIVFALRL